MSKEINKNIIELYTNNRQEITSIFTSSIILLVITLISGIFSYFYKTDHTKYEYLVLSIVIFISGMILCLLYKQIITLGWMNFKIEKELEIEKFGSEHSYFIEGSELGIIEKTFYKLICSNYFNFGNKIYYHTNLKFILIIIFLTSVACSFLFCKYLAITFSEFLDNVFFTAFIFTIICMTLLVISLFFFRKEFKTNYKKELATN